MTPVFFLNRDSEDYAVRNWIQQIVATDRPEATSMDKANLFATSVIAHRAGKKRADAVAAIPMDILDKAGKPLPQDDPLVAALLRNYRDNMRRSELTLCFWGENLLYKRRTYSGMVYQLRWVNPRLWFPEIRSKGGLVGFHVTRGYGSDDIPTRYIHRTNGVYMQEIDFRSDFKGLAPIEVAFRHAELGVEMAETQLSFMRNRAVPTSIVQPAHDTQKTPDVEERNRLQSLLQRAYQGSRNAGRTLIQRFRFEWIQLQAKFEDVEFSVHYEQAYESVSIGFDIPVSLIRESASNFAQQREVRLDWAQSWVVPRAEWYAEIFTEELAKDKEVIRKYGLGLKVIPNTKNVALLKEDDKSKIERTNMKLQGGYKDLFSAAQDTGEEQPDEGLKGYYMWAGVPTHISLIGNLSQAKLPQPNPIVDASVPQESLNATQNPAGLLPEPNKDTVPPTGKSICLMIGLSNDAELIDLQNKVKARLANVPIKWNAPADFHVTLLYAPAVTDMQIASLKAALDDVEWVDEMQLPIGSLSSFDNLGEHALHFRLRHNADLVELQQMLYDLCVGLGIQVSTYSKPENYKPHVTMGYAEQKPPTIIFQSKIKVQPQEFQLGVEDDIIYKRAWVEVGDQPTPPDDQPEPAKAFLPDDVFAELKVAARKGAAFVPEKLPKSAVTYIAFLKGLGYENDVILDAAKHFTLSVLAAKSVSATQRDFEKEFDDLIYAARNDEKNRKQVSGKLRSLVNQYVRRALVDGLVDGGIEDAVLNEDDRAIVGDLLGEAGRYVTQFLDVLFKGDGISDDQAVYKATQWWNGTIYPAYLAGLERAAADSMFEWRIGKVEQSCKSCLALDSQKHRFSEFKAAGFLPKADTLICGPGKLCDCSLIPTKGRSRGRLDTVPLAMKHIHEDEPEEEGELVV